MRLIILYHSKHARNHTNWDPHVPSTNGVLMQYATDGYPFIGKLLIEQGIIDECLGFVETNRNFGYLEISPNNIGYAIPNISCVNDLLKQSSFGTSDDILFIRGAWKHWAPHCDVWSKNHKLIYYGAGTPRHTWPYWDIVFNDFVDLSSISRRHNHKVLPFVKPINTEIFKVSNESKIHDILLNGCFHIYDKKGQYKFINAAVEYKKLFGEHLKILMPGSTYRSTHSSGISSIIESNNLQVYRSGIIDRKYLVNLITRCKLYVHIGFGEQNARSALEAMACGIPLYIASPHLWPKYVSSDNKVTKVCKDPNDSTLIAHDIHELLNTTFNTSYISNYFLTHNGPQRVIECFKECFENLLK